MTKYRTVLLVLLLVALCATSQETATGPDAGKESSAGSSGADAADAEVLNSDPLSLIESVSVLPDPVGIGEVASVSATVAPGSNVTINFGGGFSGAFSAAYLRFGRKRIAVRAETQAGSGEVTSAVTVVGRFTPLIDESEGPHDALWRPVTSGRVVGAGSYDEIRVYYGGEEVFAVPASDAYAIPIPFVGIRRIGLVLYEDGFAVTAPVEVSIYGTNQQPALPAYEGSKILPAKVSEVVEFAIKALDPNNDPIRYAAKKLPEGAELDERSGVFRWRPGASQVGYHLINFYAFDVPYDTKTAFAQRTIIVSP